MYWYKTFHKRYFGVFLFVAFLGLASSCQSEKPTATNSDYFDIQHYFQEEIRLLESSNPKVKKTVEKGEEQETQEVNINDWEQELGAFLSVDLSKPVYQNAFSIDSTSTSIVYTPIVEGIDIASVELIKNDRNKVESVKIIKKTDQLLYQNQETMEYRSQSSYSLDKTQKVLLMGTKEYFIKGEIQKN